jgi:hypothetical protein
MAGLVEQAIASAIDALVKRDSSLAEKTIREDKAIFGVIFGVSELAHNLHLKKSDTAQSLVFYCNLG